MYIYNMIAERMSRTDRKLTVQQLHAVDVAITSLLALEHPAWSILYATWALLLPYASNVGDRYTMCTGTHPYIPVAGAVEVKMLHSQLGEVVLNVLHFRFTTIVGPATLVTMAEQIKSAWNAYLKPITSEDVALEKIIVTNLETETGASIEYTTGLPSAGAYGSPILNGGQTLATKLTTDQRGRSFRGRIFNIGIPANFILSNRVADSTALARTNAWIAFAGELALSAVPLELAVVSLCHNGVWRTDGVATTVTGFSTDVWLDSQRRRLHGRGM